MSSIHISCPTVSADVLLHYIILDVANGCLGTHRRAKKYFVSQGTLNTIDQNHRAKLNGRAELFRELRRKTVCALRVDKEAYV